MKIVSIKENSDFKRLYYRGKSVVRKTVAVYFKKNKFYYNRLGITVSPKVGNAVLRNRIKRVIKENYRLLEGLSLGYDIVIVSRKRAAAASFYEIKKDLESALCEGGLLEGYETD